MSEFLISIYDAEAPYANATPELWQEVMESHVQFAEYVEQSGGAILGSRALQPTATAHSVREGVTTTGPFSRGAEAFCGYYLIEANDLDHALEIAGHCPAKFGGVEVRPIMPTPVSV